MKINFKYIVLFVIIVITMALGMYEKDKFCDKHFPSDYYLCFFIK